MATVRLPRNAAAIRSVGNSNVPTVFVAPKIPTKTEKVETTAISQLPTMLRPIVTDVMKQAEMNDLAKLLMERAVDFKRTGDVGEWGIVRAMLAGIAMHPPARKRFDEMLDAAWDQSYPPSTTTPEIVIGGGLHAAIYCAARVMSGYPKPLVIERSAHPGGAFACSVGPSFFLNSRNRPGSLSIPGDQQGALNFLPGALLQPSDLSGAEYQTNDTLAWAIRLALAMYAQVVPSRNVMSINLRSPNMGVTLNTGTVLLTKRVIVATGLGAPNVLGAGAMGFGDFMKLMDQPFPLRGMKRVAVIGAGDSGKTVIESLVGQGPQHRSSIASLDWPERIDWYGCTQAIRANWEACERSRYRGIGRYLPTSSGLTARVTPKPKATSIAKGFDCVYVDETPYDHVIDCRGYAAGSPFDGNFAFAEYLKEGRTLAKMGEIDRIFVIGPAAGLRVGSAEANVLRGIAENTTSIFRYAGRTASLAAVLK